MKEIDLGLIETPYVDAQTLLVLLKDYKKPREKISYLVKKGELIRLKNGFYLVKRKIGLGRDKYIPYEQIANFLYGPSYVSLEWALSYYGLIPEGVRTITCMSLDRSKEYSTPIGDFSYCRIPSSAFPIGVVQKKTEDSSTTFLMATPEKALADLVFVTCKGLTKEELQAELIQSKRIDPECFQKLDKKLLHEIAKQYRSKRIRFLVDLVGVL